MRSFGVASGALGIRGAKNTSEKHGRCERQLAAEKKDVREGVIVIGRWKKGRCKIDVGGFYTKHLFFECSNPMSHLPYTRNNFIFKKQVSVKKKVLWVTVTLLLLCWEQCKIDIKGGKINVGSSPFLKAKYTSRLFCSHHQALLSIAIKAPRSRLESVNIQIRHTRSSLLIHAGQEPRQNQLQPNYTCTRFTAFYPHCVCVCVWVYSVFSQCVYASSQNTEQNTDFMGMYSTPKQILFFYRSFIPLTPHASTNHSNFLI